MKKVNNNDIFLTDLNDKGVIYEPSENAKKLYKDYKNGDLRKNANRDINTTKVKKSPNFNFNLFLGMSALIGIIVFVITLSLTYSSLSSYFNFPSITDTTENKITNLNDKQNSIISDINEDKKMLGVIKNINYNKNLFNILDINTNKVYILESKPSSIFKDKYDNILSISELSLGSIVDFSFDDGNKINYINENLDSFEFKNELGVSINIENKTMKINDSLFNINNNAIILKDNKNYDLLEISSLDVLDIKGYKNEIYYINVKKGTGTLKIINKPSLTNGVLEIDRDIFMPINDAKDIISLPEGKHKVVIRSTDTSSFVKDINIKSNAETILDLSQIQNKLSTIFVKSNLSDYKLYINNEEKNISEPFKLPYGVYNVRAEKEGYETFQQQISINNERYNLNINLEKIQKLGKISISSDPDNANVFIDNTLVGQTPLNYKVGYGVHTITLKKEGYNDFVLSSVNIEDDNGSFNITMHKSKNDSTDSNSTTEDMTETTTSKPTI